MLTCQNYQAVQQLQQQNQPTELIGLIYHLPALDYLRGQELIKHSQKLHQL